MFKTVKIALSLGLALSACACGGMMDNSAVPIMQVAPGDPAGSANIGTGSVTVNSMTPREVTAAGIGVGP